MTPTESLPGDHSPAEDAAEYTLRPGARHHADAAAGNKVSSRTLRQIYFALASAWGFVVGACGILASYAWAGHDVRPEGRALAGLVPAIVVAVAGAGVIAGAYQEAKRRRRG